MYTILNVFKVQQSKGTFYLTVSFSVFQTHNGHPVQLFSRSVGCGILGSLFTYIQGRVGDLVAKMITCIMKKCSIASYHLGACYWKG